MITAGSFTGNTVSFTPEKAMTYWMDLSFVSGSTQYLATVYIRTVDPVENAAPASDFTYAIKGTKNKYCVVSAYNGTETDVIVPPVIDGCPVEAVSMEGNTSVQRVLLPVITVYIPDNAFAGCTALHTVEVTAGTADSIENGTDFIGNDAFRGCTNLKTAWVPASVTEIGSNSFVNCPNLTLQLEKGSAAETYAVENSIPYVYFS